MSDTPETAPEADGAEQIAAPPAAPEPVTEPQPATEPAVDASDREGVRVVTEWWEHFV